MRRLLEQRDARLTHCEQRLRALGPGATLERGYAIVTDAQGQVLRDAVAVELGTTSEGTCLAQRTAMHAWRCACRQRIGVACHSTSSVVRSSTPAKSDSTPA